MIEKTLSHGKRTKVILIQSKKNMIHKNCQYLFFIFLIQISIKRKRHFLRILKIF